MKPCRCLTPRPHPSPRREGICVVCGFQIRDEWHTRHIGPLFDRLAEALPGWPENLPDGWLHFRVQCEAREIAGREQFGYRYLGRDNPLDATEEAADLANYLFMDVLRARRDGRGDEDIDAALQGALHAYHAHRFALVLRHKRAGAP